ncbi:hypothetical protein [Halorarum halophilum]|nr:hypothetical protein [Halobaculum halophilum]
MTTTDALVVFGCLNGEELLGGRMPIDVVDSRLDDSRVYKLIQ